MSSRTRRSWNVGIVSCDDVTQIQARVNAYRTQLEDSIDQLPADRKLGGVGAHSTQAWMALRERCNLFEEESCTLGLFAGSQYDRGRGLIEELDGWRDYLATPAVSAPNLPDPVSVPKSDVSLFSAAGDTMTNVLLLAIGFFVVRELRS
jgi:hypothetical protein